MGSKNKKVNRGAQQRERINPRTGEEEIVTGTKAGRRRNRLPADHPLRTHDLKGKSNKKDAS
jgi:hypothetical protein